MKKIDPLSFGTGLGTGLVVLLLFMGATHLMHPSRGNFMRTGNGQFQGGGTRNVAAMAERLGMTEADLQKEIDSGKTMQEIFTEHGMQMGRGPRTGTGSIPSSASGSSVSSSTASLTSSSSSL